MTIVFLILYRYFSFKVLVSHIFLQQFDSNVITPGTPFMKKVAESLKYYIAERLMSDPGWKGVRCQIPFIFSPSLPLCV